jgi:hypothetical protein
MKRKMIYGGIIALLGIVALITGCAVQQPANTEGELAAIEVTFADDGVGSKNILPVSPDYDMAVDRYKLTVRDSANPANIVPEADKRSLDYRMCTAYTDGTMSDVRLYNRVLTAGEVHSLYAAAQRI